MTEAGPSTHGNDGGDKESFVTGGPISGLVSGSVPDSEPVLPDNGQGIPDSSAIPRKLKAGKRVSLLDAVEQSSDLGAFFRQGEGQRESFGVVILGHVDSGEVVFDCPRAIEFLQGMWCSGEHPLTVVVFVSACPIGNVFGVERQTGRQDRERGRDVVQC